MVYEVDPHLPTRWRGTQCGAVRKHRDRRQRGRGVVARCRAHMMVDVCVGGIRKYDRLGGEGRGAAGIGTRGCMRVRAGHTGAPTQEDFFEWRRLYNSRECGAGVRAGVGQLAVS